MVTKKSPFSGLPVKSFTHRTYFENKVEFTVSAALQIRYSLLNSNHIINLTLQTGESKLIHTTQPQKWFCVLRGQAKARKKHVTTTNNT
jgi:hypothetical protein